MNENLLEPQRKSSDSKSETENKKEVSERGLELANKLERQLSIIRNLQENQGSVVLQNLNLCIDKFSKSLSSQNMFKKEQEERMLSYTNELNSITEETKRIVESKGNQVAELSRRIKEANDYVKAVLEEKERHQQVLEEAKEEIKRKFEGLKQLEIQKFNDAESIYSFKKLSLSKKIKALDADMEAIGKETDLAKMRLNDLKMTNRELRSKYYKLQKN